MSGEYALPLASGDTEASLDCDEMSVLLLNTGEGVGLFSEDVSRPWGLKESGGPVGVGERALTPGSGEAEDLGWYERGSGEGVRPAGYLSTEGGVRAGEVLVYPSPALGVTHLVLGDRRVSLGWGEGTRSLEPAEDKTPEQADPLLSEVLYLGEEVLSPLGHLSTSLSPVLGPGDVRCGPLDSGVCLQTSGSAGAPEHCWSDGLKAEDPEGSDSPFPGFSVGKGEPGFSLEPSTAPCLSLCCSEPGAVWLDPDESLDKGGLPLVSPRGGGAMELEGGLLETEAASQSSPKMSQRQVVSEMALRWLGMLVMSKISTWLGVPSRLRKEKARGALRRKE